MAEIPVLAGTTRAGEMALPTSTSVRNSAMLKFVREHNSPVNDIVLSILVFDIQLMFSEGHIATVRA